MKNIIWFLRRFWREFTCTHQNSQIQFIIEPGMNIVCCPLCGRTRLYFGRDSKDVEDAE